MITWETFDIDIDEFKELTRELRETSGPLNPDMFRQTRSRVRDIVSYWNMMGWWSPRDRAQRINFIRLLQHRTWRRLSEVKQLRELIDRAPGVGYGTPPLVIGRDVRFDELSVRFERTETTMGLQNGGVVDGTELYKMFGYPDGVRFLTVYDGYLGSDVIARGSKSGLFHLLNQLATLVDERNTNGLINVSLWHRRRVNKNTWEEQIQAIRDLIRDLLQEKELPSVSVTCHKMRRDPSLHGRYLLASTSQNSVPQSGWYLDHGLKGFETTAENFSFCSRLDYATRKYVHEALISTHKVLTNSRQPRAGHGTPTGSVTETLMDNGVLKSSP